MGDGDVDMLTATEEEVAQLAARVQQTGAEAGLGGKGSKSISSSRSTAPEEAGLGGKGPREKGRTLVRNAFGEAGLQALGKGATGPDAHNGSGTQDPGSGGPKLPPDVSGEFPKNEDLMRWSRVAEALDFTGLDMNVYALSLIHI